MSTDLPEAFRMDHPQRALKDVIGTMRGNGQDRATGHGSGRPGNVPLGVVLLTRAAGEWLTPDEIERALARHALGDWADLDREDWPLSDQALATGEPVVSVHTTADGIKFWVMTEGDRRTTKIMLAERYEEACARLTQIGVEGTTPSRSTG